MGGQVGDQVGAGSGRLRMAVAELSAVESGWEEGGAELWIFGAAGGR